MDTKLCKKCGTELPTDYEKELCTDCKKKKIIKTSLAVGTVVIAGVIGGKIYINKHPETLAKMKETFKTVPSIINKPTISQTISDTAEIVQNEKKNFLSKIDVQKIEKAQAEGVLTKQTTKKLKTGWEMGLDSVDNYLGTWHAEHIIEAFPRWTEQVKNISRPELENILNEVKDDVPAIKDIKMFNETIEVTFKSNSGKTCWTALFNFFNEKGELTTDCNITTPYKEAGVQLSFLKSVRKHMKYLIENK